MKQIINNISRITLALMEEGRGVGLLLMATVMMAMSPTTMWADDDVQVENWDGTSDIILGSIRHSGDAYKAAYTWTVTSDEGFGDVSTSNPKYNVIIGTPSNDDDDNAWYDAEYKMTNDENASWVYSTTALPIFGPNENPGDVYVRRYFTTFEGASLPGTVYMPAPHNDAPCEYYINGTLVWSRTGNEPGVDGWYEDEIVRLTDEQKALIKTDGSVNVFAYHVHQNWGDRYADGGLYGDAGDVANAFNNNGNRKRLELAVKQAENVLDFNEEVLAYAKNATVCLQDAGVALNKVRYELMNRLAQHNDYYSDVASAEPADGLECWLYNVGTGMFLAGNNDKGTHASVESNMSSWPMVLHANTSGTNRYAIQTNLPDGARGANDGLGHNGYVDCTYGATFTTAADWAWEFQAAGDGTYRIINSQNSGDNIYLGVTEDYRYQVDTDKAGADNPMNRWKIIARAQLDELIMNASFMHPADATHFIHQANFSQNDFDGNDKGAANADLNDSKWECNAGAIWNWKGNDVDGDYVFEAKNTAANVDFKLSQTITGLKPGLYGVSCTGFYRDGDWESAVAGNKRQLASLYTKSTEYEGTVVLPSILDFAGRGAGYGRLESERVIPDDCRDAAKFFQYRAYYVEVEAIVGADGTLEIGVVRPADESIKENDWIVVDNFHLTCLQLTGDNLEVPSNGWATYVAPFNVSELPEGLTVYAPLKHEGYVELQEIDAVPSGEAVVVQGEPGTYTVKRSEAPVELEVTNDLIAAVSPVVADGSQYILDSKDDVIGFYKVTEETTIPAKTAYLVMSTDAKELFTFEEVVPGEDSDDNYSTLNTSPYDIAVTADGEEDATVDVKNTTAAVIKYEDGSTTLKCYDETGVMDYAELAHAVKYNITLSGIGIGAPDGDDEPTIDNGTVWAGAPRRHAMAKAPGQLPTGAALVLESNRSSHHYMAADGPISLYLKDGKYVVNGEDEFKASSITSIYYFDPHQLDEDGECTVGDCNYVKLQELTMGENTVSFNGWEDFTFTPTETSNYVISCESDYGMSFEENILGSDGTYAPSDIDTKDGLRILTTLEEGVTYTLQFYGSGSGTINIATTDEEFTPKYRIYTYSQIFKPAEGDAQYEALVGNPTSTALAYFTCDEETKRNTYAYRSVGSITLHAVEVDGCTFKGWYVNDEQISTDYEYTTEDIDRSNDYLAYYVLDSDKASGYSVVAVDCEGNGTAKFSYGEGESAVEGTVALVPNDTEVTFTATAGENATFVKWSVDDGTCRYEEGNPLTLTITRLTCVSAIFESTVSLSSGENAVDIPANNVTYCKFQPTESGVYNIYSEGNLDLDIDGNISSDDEEESVFLFCGYNDYDGDYSDFLYTVLLNAGVTYTIPLLNYSNTDAEGYTIRITAPEELTSEVTIPGDRSKIYSFTPQTTADYRFYSEGEDADLDCFIYDSEGQDVCCEGDNNDSNADNENDFNITASLTGGKTYYIKIKNCDDDNDVEDYSVNVEKVALPTLKEGEEPNLLSAEDEGYISYSFTPATTGNYRFYMEGVDDILYWEGIFDAESGEKVGDAVKCSDDYEELSILTSLVKDKEYIVKLYFNDYTEDIELYINPTTDVFVPLYNISAGYVLYDSEGEEIIRDGNNQVAYLTLNSKSNSYFYKPGGNVTFTATDRVYGFTFQGWYDKDGEILTSEHTYSTTISSDCRICALYKAKESFDIAEDFSVVSIDVDNSGTGNVSAGIEEYDNAALALLPRGTEVTLKATEADGSKFDYWIYYLSESKNKDYSSSITLTANGWVSAFAGFIEEVSEFTLTDGVKYDREDKAYVEELTYKRTVSNEQVNKWQALYVPFQMSYDDWKDKFEVATIQNFHEYTNDNGEITDMELEVRLVKNGKIKANRPYLIMPKEAGDITIELSNVTLAKAENKSVSCSSVEKTYTFTGTYEPLQEMKTNNYLFMSGGGLRSAEDDDQTLKPQRWYLTIKNTDSSVETDEVVESAAAKGINILVLDDDETAIDDIMVETTPMSSTNAKAGIYDLQGRRQESLGKGINIIRQADGTVRKVMVK